MEREVVHLEHINTTALARAIDVLYHGTLERELAGRSISPFQLSASITDAVEHFRQHDPARIERLWHRILGYQAGLAAYRLRDEAVRSRHPPTERRRVARSWQTIAALPLFAYGAVVNFLPY
jgi:hypothetical protein